MLIGAVMLTLSACKSKNETTSPAEQSTNASQQVETTVRTASNIVDQIIVPNFSNPEVTQFCNDFKTLMIEYAQHKGTSDEAKEAELEQKFTNWATQATSLVGKLQSDELAKFNQFITDAQAKFKEIAYAPAK